MLRENVSAIGVQNSLGPATLSASTNGTAIDRQGYDSVTAVINVGIGGITFDTNNKIEFKLEHSDDNSTFTAVAQSDVQASPGTTVTVGTGGIVRSLTAAKAAADTKPFKIGYIGGKRYVREVATFTGTHGTGTPVAGSFLLGHTNLGPVA